MGDLLGYLLTGLGTTLRLLAASLALGLAIGLLVALARLSRARLLRWSSTVYVEVVRGVPLLVLLLFIYYGLPQVLNGLGGGGRRPLFQISDFLSAVIAFGVCYGAYLAEIFRAGIKSVDPGQTEAARALGLSHRQAMRHVVLPQAIRNVLPALVNESVALLKDTSLASAITILEITQLARQEVTRTFDTFRIWGTVAGIYLVLTLGLSYLARMLERRQERAGTHPVHTRPV